MNLLAVRIRALQDFDGLCNSPHDTSTGVGPFCFKLRCSLQSHTNGFIAKEFDQLVGRAPDVDSSTAVSAYCASLNLGLPFLCLVGNPGFQPI